MTQPPVPAEIARLWGLTTQSRLGRPARLDLDQVVETAIALADTDGLASVTLPRVAQRLDVTKMSLYRYVGSKDELIDLMADRAFGAPPPASQSPWRESLRHWCHAMADAHRRRPWLSHVPTSGPPSGPGGIAWLDAGLHALSDTPLDWTARVAIISVLSGHVRAAVRIDHELAAGRGDTDQVSAERAWGQWLAQLVDAQRFPQAAQLFASGAFDPPPKLDDENNDFTFGLEIILDGVAAAIERAY